MSLRAPEHGALMRLRSMNEINPFTSSCRNADAPGPDPYGRMSCCRRTCPPVQGPFVEDRSRKRGARDVQTNPSAASGSRQSGAPEDSTGYTPTGRKMSTHRLPMPDGSGTRPCGMVSLCDVGVSSRLSLINGLYGHVTIWTCPVKVQAVFPRFQE